MAGEEHRTRFIEHARRPLLLMDFSNLWRVDQMLSAIEDARRFVAGQPKVQNLLVLVDVAESAIDDRILTKLKELAVHDAPWVLASAVVGMRGTQKVVHRLVSTFSGRQLAAFERREEAKDWLVAQRSPPASVPEPKR